MLSTLNRNRPWLLVAVFAVIIGLSGGYAIATFMDRADRSDNRADTAEATTQRVGVSASDLANEVLAACQDDPDELVDLGLCGEAADTKAEVDEAVAEVAQGRPGDPGPQGPAGPRGPPVTLAQVASAITTYCEANDDCRGPAGTDGKDGAAGQDSNVPGPQGPRGPAGADGSNGSDGSDGRGIASLSCTGGTPTTEYTVTYTDGTSETFTCGGPGDAE